MLGRIISYLDKHNAENTDFKQWANYQGQCRFCPLIRWNGRLFIKENQDLFFQSLNKGDKIAFGTDEGIILVTGFSDKAPRKYLKILSKSCL